MEDKKKHNPNIKMVYDELLLMKGAIGKLEGKFEIMKWTIGAILLMLIGILYGILIG